MLEFTDKIKSDLKGELSLGNINEIPKLEKIVVSVGLGKAKDDKKLIEIATNTINKITGQASVSTVAKKSVAGFKLREGSIIGVKTTLRGQKMYEFADRLINVVLPRLRDFRGVSVKSFDANGNYSIGLVEQSIFPELTYDETTTPHGIQITFVINAKQKEHARALLTKFGMPFEKESK